MRHTGERLQRNRSKASCVGFSHNIPSEKCCCPMSNTSWHDKVTKQICRVPDCPVQQTVWKACMTCAPRRGHEGRLWIHHEFMSALMIGVKNKVRILWRSLRIPLLFRSKKAEDWRSVFFSIIMKIQNITCKLTEPGTSVMMLKC